MQICNRIRSRATYSSRWDPELKKLFRAVHICQRGHDKLVIFLHTEVLDSEYTASSTSKSKPYYQYITSNISLPASLSLSFHTSPHSTVFQRQDGEGSGIGSLPPRRSGHGGGVLCYGAVIGLG